MAILIQPGQSNNFHLPTRVVQGPVMGGLQYLCSKNKTQFEDQLSYKFQALDVFNLDHSSAIYASICTYRCIYIYVYVYMHIYEKFLLKCLTVICRYNVPFPIILQCVFSKNKNIHLLNHSTTIKIKKSTTNTILCSDLQAIFKFHLFFEFNFFFF